MPAYSPQPGPKGPPPQDNELPMGGNQRPPRPPQNGAMQRSPVSISDLKYSEDGAPILDTEDKMMRYATRMIESGFVSPALNTPAKVINAMAVCRAADLPWQTWINAIYFIDNKPAVYVAFQQAAAFASGKLEYCQVKYLNGLGEERNRKNMLNFQLYAVEVTVKHRDMPEAQVNLWTVEDVKASGKGSSTTYGKFMGDMMMWRAMGRALRIQFPMASGGALIQGIHDDIEPVRDAGGSPVRTAEGHAVYQKKSSKREALDAVFEEQDRGAKQGE